MGHGLKSRLKSCLAWAAHQSGIFLLIRLLHRRLYGSGIRILFYHRVAASVAKPDLLGRSLLTAREFEKHLRHLQRFYHVVSLEQAAEILASRQAVPQNIVVITFDDGYRDNYSVAMPLLQKYNAPATVFVVSGAIDGAPLWFDRVHSWFKETRLSKVRLSKLDSELDLTNSSGRGEGLSKVTSLMKKLSGKERVEAMAELRTRLEIPASGSAEDEPAMLNWDDLREMAQSRIFTIGAHTVTHPILPRIEGTDIRAEIEDSCHRINQELGQPVRFFAYPNGDYDSRAQSVVRELDLVGCATQGAGFNPQGSDLSALRRLGAEGLPMFRFALYLAGWEDARVWLQASLKRLGRGVKGISNRFAEIAGILPAVRFLNRKRMTVLAYRGAFLGNPGDTRHPESQLQAFCRQLSWLKRKFTPISLDDVINVLDGRKPFPRRALLVTIDNPNRNDFQAAWPFFKEFGIRPVLFIPAPLAGDSSRFAGDKLEAAIKTTQALGVRLNEDWLWLRTPAERQLAIIRISKALKDLDPNEQTRAWNEIRLQLSPETSKIPLTFESKSTWKELAGLIEQGVSVGSCLASYEHLAGRSGDEIAQQMRNSRRELESELRTDVRAFSYPDSGWNPEIRQCVEESGYACAFTRNQGAVDFHSDRFVINRIPMNGNESFNRFLSAASGITQSETQKVGKVLEISNYPPPQCGWAMQTKLLVDTLRRRGAACEVMNINESRKIRSPEYVDVQNGMDYFLKVLRFTARGYRPHTHVNAESPKGYLLALAANLTGRALGQPAVMTFHGGLPQTYFPRPDSAFLRITYRLLFLSAGSITCDSLEIEQAIRSYKINGKPIVSIPCFSLQNLDFGARPLSPEIEAFLQDRHPVFFCFLCFRPEYGLETVLAGMRKFSEQHPRAGFIWLGYPSKEAPPLNAFLDSQPHGRPENLLLAGNLDHDTFMTLLTRCFAYLRPHVRDGVSASVLESLALSVPVIAADNGMRPPGVIKYNFEDADNLCQKLIYVVENYEAVRNSLRSQGIDDNIDRVVDWLLHSENTHQKLIHAPAVQN